MWQDKQRMTPEKRMQAQFQRPPCLSSHNTCLNAKLSSVSPEIRTEIQLSADIIARIDSILKEKNMSQRDLARKMGKSEAVVSRWTTGFPNLTLRSIAELSTALGEPLIQVTK